MELSNLKAFPSIFVYQQKYFLDSFGIQTYLFVHPNMNVVCVWSQPIFKIIRKEGYNCPFFGEEREHLTQNKMIGWVLSLSPEVICCYLFWRTKRKFIPSFIQKFINKTWSSVSNSTLVLPFIPHPSSLFPLPLFLISYPLLLIPYPYLLFLIP